MKMKLSTAGLRTTPFLVIGSGIAGLYTALKLAEIADVTLISKDMLEESNTSYAQGGIAVALSPADSPDSHYKDTIKAGAGLCLPPAVTALVNEGPERVRELIAWGVPFDFDAVAGNFLMTREAAHSFPRVLHADGDATGREISKALARRVRSHPRITVKEYHYAVALLTGEEGCYGALVLDETGTQTSLLAEATILATGGCGQIFTDTTNPAVATGDGLALAYLAGAPLADLEFVQFHPTALHLDGAPSFLITEAVRGEGGLLRNRKGVRFMPSYHPQAELAPRDVVARSVWAEMAKTGSDHVFLDLSLLSAELIKRRFPNIYETCLGYGLDITKEPIPVAPAAHYMMGGVAVDLYGRTALPGLFACGEVANPGVHGANRLASNSLLDGLVFGHHIFEYLQSGGWTRPALPPELTAVFPTETNPEDLTADRLTLKELASAHLGIIRREEDLQNAQRRLAPATPAGPVPLSRPYLELQNMRLLVRLMLEAACTRRESRGSHYRADYPETDPNWRKRIVFSPAGISFIPADQSFDWPW
ncbi:MAG TPA: L-aspartate oxidase [Firmicutes bacterium]|uniref:L-aspartate oxidase n=1 Tax=Capillibacterium thermochitinicola TaxID=2699427 RepID=A0A8J6I055_9FIRM|nr:L-aspartate oxidase [Capillibacterium thermochitinicola]MBA2133170.1 L-aspartate oxidase [Capillibacterium thermochitinicola]HHW11713.1 L-aspartate oxidase [Bacillota bacterium]